MINPGRFNVYALPVNEENEVPVEYVVFPDEGHGFRNKQNRITAAEAYAKFLDTYLKAPK